MTFKQKAARLWSWIKIAALIGIGASITFFAGAAFYSTSTVTASTDTVVLDKLPEKIAGLKADVINQISDCERAGKTEEDGIIVFDSNARASIGVMQFQKATVIQYEKILYGKDISGKDAILIALDNDQAKALATDIVFQKDGLANWLNCANQHGLRADVNAIYKLEK